MGYLNTGPLSSPVLVSGLCLWRQLADGNIQVPGAFGVNIRPGQDDLSLSSERLVLGLVHLKLLIQKLQCRARHFFPPRAV